MQVQGVGGSSHACQFHVGGVVRIETVDQMGRRVRRARIMGTAISSGEVRVARASHIICGGADCSHLILRSDAVLIISCARGAFGQCIRR